MILAWAPLWFCHWVARGQRFLRRTRQASGSNLVSGQPAGKTVPWLGRLRRGSRCCLARAGFLLRSPQRGFGVRTIIVGRTQSELLARDQGCLPACEVITTSGTWTCPSWIGRAAYKRCAERFLGEFRDCGVEVQRGTVGRDGHNLGARTQEITTNR